MLKSLEIPVETVLERAVRGFVVARRRAERDRATGAELRFLFARIGLTIRELDTLALAAHGREIEAPLRGRLETLLGTERLRLVRLARAGSAAYDFNRHLAIRRALRWIEGREAADGAEPAGASGTALNARFRRRRTRNRPT